MKQTYLLCLILSSIYCVATTEWSHAAQYSGAKWARSPTARALKAIAKTSPNQEASYLKAARMPGRQLAQEYVSDCVWMDDECSLKKDMAMNMMEGKSSPLSKFFKAIFTCEDKESYDACTADNWCHWVIDECSANDEYLEDESVSNCLGEASIFLEIPERTAACESTDSDGLNGCERELEGCSLNLKNECKFDFWLYTIGVPSGNYGLQGFREASVHQAKFWTEALLADLPFLLSTNASRYLDWTPPKADCPEGVAQIVCDYAAPLGQTYATSLFCEAQYKDDAEGCVMDSRCETKGGKCTPSEAVITEVTQKQLQVLSDYSLNDALVSDILLPFVSCSSNVESSCGSECKWDARRKECNPDHSWIQQKLASITASSSEPKCKLLTAVLASGCIASSNPECTANPKCSWNLVQGECETSTDEIIAVLTSVAPDVRDVVQKQVECNSHVEKKSCV